ncbi:hypothetical protein [Sagittula sp. SSi028]
MKTRFVKSIVATAKASDTTRLPWERGSTRKATIAARKPNTTPTLKRA